MKGLLKYLIPVIMTLTAITLFAGTHGHVGPSAESEYICTIAQTDSYACNSLESDAMACIPMQITGANGPNLTNQAGGSRSVYKYPFRSVCSKKEQQLFIECNQDRFHFPVKSTSIRHLLLLSFLNRFII